MTKIIAFSGSTRSESFNRKILNIAIKGAQQGNAEVTLIDLRDFPLPIYDGDYEVNEGIPANVKKLKELFLKHQGLLLALPEYNSSISGVFKNTIDWISRPMIGEKPMECFKEKVAALISASTGKLGGIRGLVHARSILGNINVLVIPDQICVGMAEEAFDKEGKLKDEKIASSIERLGEKLALITQKIHDHQ